MPGKGDWIMIMALLTFTGSPALAQDPAAQTTGGLTAETADESPSMELLEFLADWETDDGQWIDPEEINEIDLQVPEEEDTHAK